MFKIVILFNQITEITNSMKHTLNTVITIFLSALMTLPAMVQWVTPAASAAAPPANFRSTSAMPSSGSFHAPDAIPSSGNFRSTSTMPSFGSAYSAVPHWNSDGTAYDAASGNYAQASSGPRRISPVTPEGDPTPVGDAMLPLLMMALVYASASFIRRKRKVT